MLGNVPIAGADEGFHPTNGDEIRTVLTDARVNYLGKDQGVWQIFHADGRTFYAAGAGESWGTWFVQGDQYCSTWGASPLASYYDMARNGDAVRFIGSRGDIYEGVVK
ncbi:hypothetical protein [Aliiroseovarius crassostreae]|uniref:hypothetical protein n=1 Tax=Aliiroseovarius crassostreae TaxID=154981 RepID=UPI003C7D12E3